MTRTKTEMEADCYRVLGFLISQGAWERENRSGEQVERDEKYQWTNSGIRRQLNWGTVRTAMTLDISWRLGDVEKCSCAKGITYYVTEQGLGTYRAARERPELAGSEEVTWREEAQQGITTKGEETKIKDAAIPKRRRQPASAVSFETLLLMAALARRMVMNECGVTEQKARQGLESGKYIICGGYETKTHAAELGARDQADKRQVCAACRKRQQRDRARKRG